MLKLGDKKQVSPLKFQMPKLLQNHCSISLYESWKCICYDSPQMLAINAKCHLDISKPINKVITNFLTISQTKNQHVSLKGILMRARTRHNLQSGARIDERSIPLGPGHGVLARTPINLQRNYPKMPLPCHLGR